jgi:hypothetical protein
MSSPQSFSQRKEVKIDTVKGNKLSQKSMPCHAILYVECIPGELLIQNKSAIASKQFEEIRRASV